jgi:hypothetical protein
VLTGAFLSVVANTITLKTHGSVPMSTMAILRQLKLEPGGMAGPSQNVLSLNTLHSVYANRVVVVVIRSGHHYFLVGKGTCATVSGAASWES